MKILHVINNLNCGGAETLLLNIVAGLKEYDASLEISVVILEENLQLLEAYQQAGIEIIHANCLHLSIPCQIITLTKIFRARKPDIVHSHLLLTDRVALMAAWLVKVPKRFCTIHSMESKCGKKSSLIRTIISFFATQLITVSESVRYSCTEKRLYPPQKMLTIYNSPGFKPTKTVPQKEFYNFPLRLINVARLTEAKGQCYILKALKKVHQKGIHCTLIIWGDGEEIDSLRDMILTLGLQDTVTLAGTTKNIEDELVKHDLFISASLWEGMPMAPIESIKVGLPVLLSDIPPHREILSYAPEVCEELLFAPQSSTAIAEKIIDFWKRKRNYSKHLKQIAPHFSHERMIQQYYEIYHQ